MLIPLIRTLILYLLVIIALRLMGKRQIGEFQPSELVTTILISELAAIPMQQIGAPVSAGLVPIFSLVLLEVILSVLCLKWQRLRRAVYGKPAIIIQDGKLDQQVFKRLRLSVDDLMEALRQQNVFDISEAAYVILETNGKLSVLKKPTKQNVTAEMLNLTPPDNGLTLAAVADGKIQKDALYLCALDEVSLKKLLKEKGIGEKQLFLMTADKAGNQQFFPKEG